ncbi:class I SAM-dependent RNA methyltransferase [Pararhizobium haloflavum]|uniref:class I SAM-dependent RNA methyltransferase n=1 Tax=Pararhizobium haloflavum TaxID=2037914 RepID=UPI000C184B65|nr:class I SAM-dependent RNA methyltransferase [Pararhizobium haloflavum]
MSADTVTITALGAQGDGVARIGGGAVFVPFTLPGETVSIAQHKDRADLLAIKAAAPERVAPPCPHFGPDSINGACGGCSLQHMERGAYENWKRNLVVAALAEAGLAAEVAPLTSCLPGARRRMTLTARRTEKGMVLGLSEAGSHTIVAIDGCLVAAPAIAQRLGHIARIASAAATGTSSMRLTVLATPVGLDIAIEGPVKLGDRQRRMLIETALTMTGIARVAIGGEIIVEPEKPLVQFGKATIHPPPGSFLQASEAAEAVMANDVMKHLKRCKRIADLFCGSGTFTLRLAERAMVHAVESERAALDALDGGFRRTPGLKTVTTERRDLFRSPLMPMDLKHFDGLVFDPPRAGAQAQAAEIARSAVKRVAAVSCNPVTLARDLATLVAGGYRLTFVRPIDQFLWTSHVEVVALLER